MILPVILGLAALGGLLIIAKRKAPAFPEVIPPVIVRFDVDEMVLEIMEADSLPELHAYYIKIGSLFIDKELSHVEYLVLYRAYENRFYELTGGA